MVSASFLAAVVWGSVLVVAGSAVLAWRQRPKPGATSFAMTMLAATWWVTVSAIGLFTTTEALSVFWAKVEWAGIVYFPVGWLAFALAYTGRSEYLSRRNVALLSGLPTLTLAVAMTNGVYHDLLLGAPEFHRGGQMLVTEQSFGPWMWVHVGYSYLLLAAGLILVAQLVTERRLLYRGQAFALVLVVAAPWVGSVAFVSGLTPVEFFDPTPYTFVISGAAGIGALTQLEFLDSVPVTNRVAHRSVVENVDAGVLVADTEHRIVEANPRAESLLAAEGTSLKDDDLSVWLPVEDEGERVREGEIVIDDRGARTRYLDVTETELTDEYDNVTGRIILLRDVTVRQNRVQRLNVLNRVLRHNLRNEMNVIHGQAGRLVYDDDADPELVATAIQKKATDLTSLANKARELNQMFGNVATLTTDLCDVVAIERDRILTNEREVTVDFRTPDGTVQVDAAAGTVIRNLIENAIEHNTADNPRVGIDVAVEDDRARAEITDNGPGIPDGELAVFDGDLETQLDHASGLGLWVIHWGVSAVGGSIEFTDRDPTGTCVTVRFPLAEDPAPTDSEPTENDDRTQTADVTDEPDAAGTTADESLDGNESDEASRSPDESGEPSVQPSDGGETPIETAGTDDSSQDGPSFVNGSPASDG